MERGAGRVAGEGEGGSAWVYGVTPEGAAKQDGEVCRLPRGTPCTRLRGKKRYRVFLQFNFSGVSAREDIHPRGKPDSCSPWPLQGTPSPRSAKVIRNLAGFPSDVRPNISPDLLDKMSSSSQTRPTRLVLPNSSSQTRPPRLVRAGIKSQDLRLCGASSFSLASLRPGQLPGVNYFLRRKQGGNANPGTCWEAGVVVPSASR